jgi:hydrogenase-4 component B
VVGALALAGIVALGIGTLVPVAHRGLRPGLAIQALGIAATGVAGAVALFDGAAAGSAFRSSIDPAFGIDPLTGFFLLALGLVGVPAIVYADGYLAGDANARPVSVLGGVFLLTLVGVVCARDAATFLFFWELMTLVPAVAILVRRPDRRVRRDVLVYVAITHLGGVGVWLALIPLQQAGALGDGAPLHAGGLATFIAIAAVIGFGTKAGLMPAHPWLPRAHPVAPSHLSAVMSGLMIKVALYGLIRVVFEWLDAPPIWLGALLLALGGLSALGGVLYALFQHELKRLLAFHSIENIGIIVLGLGAALVFQDQGENGWAAVAFAAALLHTLNHAVFKALLFLGAGAFERAVHSLELDRLGGLLRRMPWTGGAFLVGAMAIAGVPPLNGFASEWLTFQALLHLATEGPLGIAIGGLFTTVALAATAALAVFCFVKVVGLVLLGQPRRPACEQAVEAPWSMRASMLTLAALCVLLGLLPGLLLPELAALRGGVLPRESGLPVPQTGSVGTLAVALLLAAVVVILIRLRGRRATQPQPHWACGQLVEPALNWTSAGFTKPLRLILELALRPQRTIVVHRRHGIVLGIEYAGSVPHLFETALYRPVVRASLAAAARARRVQSGSLRLYVAGLVVLVVVTLALARSGALG